MVEKKSLRVAIVSDIHFDLHHVPSWNAFRKWHSDVQPDKTIILGDFVDLGMMSRYIQGINESVHAIPQIKCFVEEANELADESGELIVLEGNHDERWDKFVYGANPAILKDALGLTLEDQCYAQGLNKNISWIREDILVRGVPCGPFILRHGHNQSGKFGGGKHLAANRISKSLGQSEVFGHHHRAQLYCQTAHGKTAIAISNPALTGDHNYSKDPDWQRGFTILEIFGKDVECATPYVVIMDNGRFAWNGKVYDGN